MTQFRFTTVRIERNIYKNAGTSISMIFDAQETPSRIVEAKNVKELEPLFQQFVADVQASGKHYAASARMVSRRDRKPAGFDKATDRGGSLNAYINLETSPVHTYG